MLLSTNIHCNLCCIKHFFIVIFVKLSYTIYKADSRRNLDAAIIDGRTLSMERK